MRGRHGMILPEGGSHLGSGVRAPGGSLGLSFPLVQLHLCLPRLRCSPTRRAVDVLGVRAAA